MTRDPVMVSGDGATPTTPGAARWQEIPATSPAMGNTMGKTEGRVLEPGFKRRRFKAPKKI